MIEGVPIDMSSKFSSVDPSLDSLTACSGPHPAMWALHVVLLPTVPVGGLLISRWEKGDQTSLSLATVPGASWAVWEELSISVV